MQNKPVFDLSKGLPYYDKRTNFQMSDFPRLFKNYAETISLLDWVAVPTHVSFADLLYDDKVQAHIKQVPVEMVPNKDVNDIEFVKQTFIRLIFQNIPCKPVVIPKKMVYTYTGDLGMAILEIVQSIGVDLCNTEDLQFVDRMDRCIRAQEELQVIRASNVYKVKDLLTGIGLVKEKAMFKPDNQKPSTSLQTIVRRFLYNTMDDITRPVMLLNSATERPDDIGLRYYCTDHENIIPVNVAYFVHPISKLYNYALDRGSVIIEEDADTYTVSVCKNKGRALSDIWSVSKVIIE